jgi:hypothetical protein
MPIHLHGAAMPTSGLCDTQYSSNPFPHSVEEYSRLTPGGMFAPIFGDFTIPPYYPSQQTLPPLPPQQMFLFASNTASEGYQAVRPLETSSGGVLPVRDPESQGEFHGQ